MANNETVAIEEASLHNKVDFAELAAMLSKTIFSNYLDTLAVARLAAEKVTILRQIVDGKNSKIFFARLNGKAVGFAVGAGDPKLKAELGAKFQLPEGKDYSYTLSAVLPEFQRKGIASLLNAARENHARELGCKNIYGITEESNFPRIKQFTKEGFDKVSNTMERTPMGRIKHVTFVKRL